MIWTIEDSNAETDGNFVMTSNNEIVEIQTTAEEKPFNKDQFQKLLNLAEISTKKIQDSKVLWV